MMESWKLKYADLDLFDNDAYALECTQFVKFSTILTLQSTVGLYCFVSSVCKEDYGILSYFRKPRSSYRVLSLKRL